MKRLGHATSTIVDRTIQKRHDIHSSHLALTWGGLNLLLAIITCAEISYGSLRQYFSFTHPVIWYAECGLAFVFTLNTLVDFLRYLAPTFSSAVVELTPKQTRLLGIRPNEPGFREVTPKPHSPNGTPGLIFSPSSFTSHSPNLSVHSSPYSPGSPASRLTPPGAHSTSRTPSPQSGHQRVSPSHSQYALSGSYVAPSSSYTSPAGGSFLHASGSFISQSTSVGPTNPSASFSASFNLTGAGSPLTPTSTLSPLFRDSMDASGLRSRLPGTPNKASPLRADDYIRDKKQLNQYLKEQNAKDYKNQIGSSDTSPGSGPSFWNYNRSISDYTPVLRKYQYQVACRSPQSTAAHGNDPDDQATFRAEEVWNKIGVFGDEVHLWTENLRKWLSQTIMVQLVKQIQKINRDLARLGSEDMQIGEVSISTLKQLAVTKQQQIPDLNALVPYLEASTNQEYLVKRILELGSGGCMSDFKWNGGAEYKGKAWESSMPTDAFIVMHMLCTYMDSHLPAHPKYPDGKTFTSQYFLTTPDKPDLKKPDNLLLYQTQINPPHYKVIIGDDTWDLAKGRNNMFHAILLFLHHIHTKQNGMLGRVNMGLSGINISWVLDV